MTDTHTIWRGLDPDATSLEHLSLQPWSQATGTVVKTFDAHGYALNYSVKIGHGRFPERVAAVVAGGARLTLTRDAGGLWRDAEGHERRDLRGATDVDISATPFTNSIPLRRLNLAVGAVAELLVVWIGIPDLKARPVPQRYTRLSPHTYRYENLTSGYRNEIILDARGLVALYPGAFEQLDILNS
ncbi:putative glycolipid-binding domain-containing protein [Deinococcus fonticola]|uniref:putative glycolipid-binding domain-containing protein n=1 Tax=Deinococcus fonticola TaxID=2528713 RepID=UPI001074CAE7|nr:putative glycolipid-binding domain-containing protein [Deinococcus fonticola]